MKAAVVTAFGGPEVLVTQAVPDPAPGPGEVLIEVHVADVLWVETMIRRGAAADVFDHQPPYVPGNGVGGRVAATGADVDEAWLGRVVVAHTGERGGYAERVAVPVDALAPVPGDVPLATAVALLHDGVTALALLEDTAVAAGDRVLVVGASGGLGIASVQLAKARGAHVVATARDPRKLERVRLLGADTVIDTDAGDWVEAARAALGGEGADVVLDNVGGALGEAAFALVARGGRFSAHGTPSGSFARIDPAEAERRGVALRGIEHVQLSPAQVKRHTDAALAEAARGSLDPVIGQTFPLARAGEAHAAIEERRVFGKTLLEAA